MYRDSPRYACDGVGAKHYSSVLQCVAVRVADTMKHADFRSPHEIFVRRSIEPLEQLLLV